MRKINVVMLVGDGDSSRFMFNALSRHFNIQAVFVDEALSKKKMLKWRVKKLGYVEVFGQVLFMLYVKLVSRLNLSKTNELIESMSLNKADIPASQIKFVGNLNSKKAIEKLQEISPDIVVVNGTRILREKLMNAVDAHFINTHVGITPQYRGVHGGYWSLRQGDEQNCGVTVHLVDKGVDTGGVLYQNTISVEKSDNFLTYPVKQLSCAIPLMKQAIEDCASGNENVVIRREASKQWYHPTWWGYLYHRITKGVK